MPALDLRFSCFCMIALLSSLSSELLVMRSHFLLDNPREERSVLDDLDLLFLGACFGACALRLERNSQVWPAFDGDMVKVGQELRNQREDSSDQE